MILLFLTLLFTPASAVDSHDMQGTKPLSEVLLNNMARNEGSYIIQTLPNDWTITAANNSTLTTTSRTLFNTESKHIYSISYSCTMTEQVGLVEMMDASIRMGDIGNHNGSEPEDVLFRFMKSNEETYTTETRSVKDRWYAPRNTKKAIEAIKSADSLQIVFIVENKEYKTITISLTGSSKAIETVREQCK
jgi:VCBS repeat-containing protein